MKADLPDVNVLFALAALEQGKVANSTGIPHEMLLLDLYYAFAR